MPIDKISQAQFAEQITREIDDRADLDTAYGPVPDACINPQAAVFEGQNDRVRALSLRLTLTDPDVFEGFESDLEGIVANEGTTRNLGTGSSTVAVFSRASAPAVDALVQRGFPIGSVEDTASGGTITFVTSEAKTMPAASAASYFNIQTQRYELSVPVVSVLEGVGTKVGPNRLTRPLRPLGGFDAVTNPNPTTGGDDAETNAVLIARFLLGVVGRQIGVAAGIERLARADFAVGGMKVVFGTNPLLVRAASDAGAVDAWVRGSSPVQVAENAVFLGVGQLIAVMTPPLVSVVSVQSGANLYIEGQDYEVVTDATGVGRSVREAAGIRFLPGGPTALPLVGDVVTTTFTYDNLVRALQAGLETEETEELGRDLLFRRGIEVPIVLTSRLRTRVGFNTTTVANQVTTALVGSTTVVGFVNGLNLGDDVEASDIQGVVRTISGVDNFIIDRLTRSTVLAGTSDIAVEDNEYPSLSTANFTVTPI